jgi:hypothetical protein
MNSIYYVRQTKRCRIAITAATDVAVWVTKVAIMGGTIKAIIDRASLLFELPYRFMQLPEALFIFTNNITDFPVINPFTVIVLIQNTFWVWFR